MDKPANHWNKQMEWDLLTHAHVLDEVMSTTTVISLDNSKSAQTSRHVPEFRKYKWHAHWCMLHAHATALQGRIILYYIPISKLRTSVHALRIETGRYARPSTIPADQRTCWFCNNSEIEDEPHFLCSCKLYDELLERSPLLKYCSSLNCSFPHLSGLDKFSFVWSVKDNKLHHLLGAFIYKAFKHWSAQLRV